MISPDRIRTARLSRSRVNRMQRAIGLWKGLPRAATDTPIEPEVRVGLPRNVTLRMALVTMDDVDPHMFTSDSGPL